MSKFIVMLRRVSNTFGQTEAGSHEVRHREVIRCIPVDTEDRTAIDHFMRTSQPRVVATLLDKHYQVELPLEQSTFGFRQMVELMQRRSGSDPFVASPYGDHAIVLWTEEELAVANLGTSVVLDPDNHAYQRCLLGR